MIDQNELMTAVEQILAARNNQPQQAQPNTMPNMGMIPAGSIGGYYPPQTAAPTAPTGISFRIAIPLPDGRTVSAQLLFGPEILQNPQALPAVIMQLMQIYPIDAYQPKQQQGGWGGNGYGNGGSGYRPNRGGWQR